VWRPGSVFTQVRTRVVSDHRPRRRKTGLPFKGWTWTG